MSQVEAEVKRLEEKTKELRDAIKTSKEQQASAKEECSKLEKDMREFKNNKEGKTEELKACIYIIYPATRITHPAGILRIGRN